jgi:hypothetical protein
MGNGPSPIHGRLGLGIYGYTYSIDGAQICTRIALDTRGYLIEYKTEGQEQYTYMYGAIVSFD